MVDRRYLTYFDWGLLALTGMLAAIGLMTLYSAVMAGVPTPQEALFTKQLVWYGIGLVAMLVCLLFSYKLMERYAWLIYSGSIVLLLWVMFFGKYIGGSRRWIVLGPVSLQPSELAKIAVIIVLARYYAKYVSGRGFTFKSLQVPVIMTLVPFLLIVRQPDLGTAGLIGLIAASMTLFVKIEKRTLWFILGSGLAMALPMWFFFLKEYQRQRILTFINPDRDPLGAGYHIIQSKIAIGSGFLTGKGFLEGTQNALSFLPEQHTDFIFSVLAEEWGFMGAVILIFIFLIFIFWALNIAYSCRDPFGTILAVGITAMIAWQAVINMGMVMGLMPVVGVPLPFISYGGSSLLTTMICVGILLNISMRRFMIE
ncbi:MAG: rod shape-determining protein RodA [Desulfobacteraceae bacterium]|nr:rod shape-determining protein RodA [Desulfobacteraceae bacterium]MBC2752337.1 rod shape-determining protein RodA [Desulfobacteraceae bacterium]